MGETATPRRSSRDLRIWRPRESRPLTVPTGHCSSRAASLCDFPPGGRARSDRGTCPEGGSARRGAGGVDRSRRPRREKDPWAPPSARWRRIGTARRCSAPICRAIGHAVEPGGERVAHPDRSGLADQDQERRLECVVRVVRAAEDLPADPHDHRPMPMDQLSKRRLGRPVPCPSFGETAQQLGVAQAGQSPGCPELLELLPHGIGLACHMGSCPSGLIVPQRECGDSGAPYRFPGKSRSHFRGEGSRPDPVYLRPGMHRLE